MIRPSFYHLVCNTGVCYATDKSLEAQLHLRKTALIAEPRKPIELDPYGIPLPKSRKRVTYHFICRNVGHSEVLGGQQQSLGIGVLSEQAFLDALHSQYFYACGTTILVY
jgi:hypothetical protein